MKKTISLLISVLLLLTVRVPVGAEKTYEIKNETLDQFKDYVGVKTDLKKKYPFRPYGGAEQNWFQYENGDEAAANVVFAYPDFGTFNDQIFLFKQSGGLNGRVIGTMRVKFLHRFNNFNVYFITSNGAGQGEINIYPDWEKGTSKYSYRTTADGTAGKSLTLTAEKNVLPLDKWMTLKMVLNTETRTYSFYIDYEDGNGDTVLFEDVNVRDTSLADGVNNVQRFGFAFNRSVGSGRLSGTAYLDDFNLYTEYRVKSVAKITESVAVGEEYSLPATVSAVMEDDEVKEQPVTWSPAKADTSAEGVYTFSGVVEDYAGSVELELTVKNLKIKKINDIENSVEHGADFVLPEKIPAVMEDDSGRDVEVVWDTAAETDKTGDFIFYGTVKDYAEKVKYTLHVLPRKIAELNERPKIFLGQNTEDSMPEMVQVKYLSGEYGFEPVSWNPLVTNSNSGNFTSTGTVAGYDGAIQAEITVYETPQPIIHETMEGKPAGYILRTNPWVVNTPMTVTVQPDPKREGNMTAIYRDTNDYIRITPRDPESREMVSKGGTVVISYELLLPKKYSDFRMMLQRKDNTACTEIYFDCATRSVRVAGKAVEVGNCQFSHVFPLEEWFCVKMILNTDTMKYDLFINNVKIAEDVWFSKGTEDNEDDWSIYSIRFANRSSDEGFEAYLDNISMYAMEELILPVYNTVKFEETEIAADKVELSSGSKETSVTWSSKPSLIAADGSVTHPAWGEGNAEVVLTAIVSKNVGGYAVSKKKSFNVLVMQQEATAAQKVQAALDKLNFSDLTEEDAAAVTKDLQLPTAAADGVSISWSSSLPTVVDERGRIYIPESAQTVTLKATASLDGIQLEKTFSFTVVPSSGNADLTAVRRAMQNLTVPTIISGNIDLIKSAENGVSVAWQSNNLSALDNDGTYKKPSKDITVILTAILSKGEAREEKKFTVTVKAYRQSGGGGGSGSGNNKGGAGSAYTPAVTEETKTDTPQEVKKFRDLQHYAWAEKAIDALAEQGIVNGTGEETFEPARSVLREEFLAMAVRGFEIAASREEENFADVPSDAWYYGVCLAAKTQGVTKGIGENCFGVGLEITREDLAVMLYQLLTQKGADFPSAKDSFSDEPEIAAYAREAINALSAANIISGADGSFLPKKTATRAEAAKLLYGALEYLKK